MEPEERRQSNEIAIARLEVNLEFIKEQLKTLTESLNKSLERSCSDCETAIALEKHIGSGWDRFKFWGSTIIAGIALIWTFIKK